MERLESDGAEPTIGEEEMEAVLKRSFLGFISFVNGCFIWGFPGVCVFLWCFMCLYTVFGDFSSVHGVFKQGFLGSLLDTLAYVPSQ